MGKANPDRIPVVPDNGCDESPSCFTCPLPECKFVVMDRAREREVRTMNPERVPATNTNAAPVATPVKRGFGDVLAEMESALAQARTRKERLQAALEECSAEEAKLARAVAVLKGEAPVVARTASRRKATPADCPECGRAFSSRQGVSLHRTRAHGQPAEAVT